MQKKRDGERERERERERITDREGKKNTKDGRMVQRLIESTTALLSFYPPIQKVTWFYQVVYS